MFFMERNFSSGSSNGTFVNRSRLSKNGEESALTEIFSNDEIRFGTEVEDKTIKVRQKCIIADVTLIQPDGEELGENL